MKYELWKDPDDNSICLVETPIDPQEFLHLTGCNSILLTSFDAQTIEEAMIKRDAFMGW